MLADRLRQLRRGKALTQHALAVQAGVSLTVVTFLETGRTTDPNVSSVRALARVLGCSLDTLVGTDDDAAALWTREVPPWRH